MRISDSYSAVSARVDLFGGFPMPTVVIDPDRRDADRQTVDLTPRQARSLARMLVKHANFLDPPKKKMVKS